MAAEPPRTPGVVAASLTGCVFSDRPVGRTTLVGVSFLIAGRDVPTGCVFSDRSVGRITLVGVSFLIAGRDVSVALGRKKVKQSRVV